jgi:glycosyltransferase involved in cell wall biosynthesis
MASDATLTLADAMPLSSQETTAGASERLAPLDAPLLTIVIPALNEEESIGSTVQRCLDAREHICRVGEVRDIEVVVVSDGSTDRTVEIAREITQREPSVRLIVFERNRGYGAAIKEGFAQGRGSLVSFLDADGTCDPNYFGELCRVLQREGAAVAVGSRMQPGNQMPRLRRLGNTIYALLLGSLSGKAVTDTASGMRVLRRDILNSLYPLPDGLHFTPAMSARAVMSDERIVEIPMSYAERVGESKLSVLRDGVRFLFAIRDAVLLYHPSRILGLAAAACLVSGIIWGTYPFEFYLRMQRLEEWMIYRLLLCGFLFSASFSLMCASVLSERILSLVYHRRDVSFTSALFDRLLGRARLFWIAVVGVVAAVALVWPGLVEYVRTGHVTLHWSRPLVAVSLLQISVFAIAYGVLQKVTDLWSGQLKYAQNVSRSERPHAA